MTDILTVEIPTSNPKEYRKQLRFSLRQIIVASIVNTDHLNQYEYARLLLPLWLELRPTKHHINLLTEICENHLKEAQEKVGELVQLLEMEKEIRKMDKALKKRRK